ncbi:hypothetical protein C8R45DRAFT_1106939 [Mycena sanguinolenta]|nr:hypothetical protein C8R45DRAFT_1106939 [Mycena sanguinolenta]
MKITAILALAAVCVTATPVDLAPPTADTTLKKRSTEALYLANCVSEVSCCAPSQYWSEMIYYANNADSNNSEYVPPSSDRCRVTSPGSGYTSWEGNQKSCTFSSGVTFAEAINSNAQSLADFSYSGWGWNGKTWNCYKDNHRWLFDPYEPEAVTGCQSIYYCLPA